MNNEIKSLSDLYRLLHPAFKSKKREMHDLKYFYVSEMDLWDYMTENVWEKSTNLTISDMVDDILNMDNDKIASYIASKLLESRHGSNEE